MKNLGVLILALLLPHAALGWSNSTQDSAYYSPTPQPVDFCSHTLLKEKPHSDKTLFDLLSYLFRTTTLAHWLFPENNAKEAMPMMRRIIAEQKPPIQVHCNVKFYTLYSEHLQSRLVRDCFEYAYHGASYRHPDCVHLEKINQEHDSKFPEFVRMRAEYRKLIDEYEDYKQEAWFVDACFLALLEDENWGYHENCREFTIYLTPVYPANSSQPSLRESFRWYVFEDHLKAICSDLTRPEAGSKLCRVFNEKRVADCFFAPVKNSFCKVIQHSFPKRSGILSYYDKLNELYNQLKGQSDRQQGLVIDCFQNHRMNQTEPCKGISWDRQEPKSAMEAKAFALYDRLVQLSPLPTTTMQTTTNEITTVEPSTLETTQSGQINLII